LEQVRFAALSFALLAALGSGAALADAEPPPRPGFRSFEASLEMDQTKLPPDRVLGWARPAKWTRKLDENMALTPLRSLVRGQRLIFVCAVPVAETTLGVTAKACRERGAEPVSIELPAVELPSDDPRVAMTRRARVVSADPLRVELVEDVFLGASGEVICRSAPAESDIDSETDPCKKKTPTELSSRFVHEHALALGSGVLGAVALFAGAWVVRRRRRAT